MPDPRNGVATGRGFRVSANTLRWRLATLIALSVALHLLTPIASWVGFLGTLMLPAARPPPPPEELDAIPIDLLKPGPRLQATGHGEIAELITTFNSMIDRLETGMMGLNVGVLSNAAAPFGGVKQSGIGREGGIEGIHEYLSTKYTMIPAE